MQLLGKMIIHDSNHLHSNCSKSLLVAEHLCSIYVTWHLPKFLQTVDMTDVPPHTVTQPHCVVPLSTTSTDQHGEGAPSTPATIPFCQLPSGSPPLGPLLPPFMLPQHRQVFNTVFSCIKNMESVAVLHWIDGRNSNARSAWVRMSRLRMECPRILIQTSLVIALHAAVRKDDHPWQQPFTFKL